MQSSGSLAETSLRSLLEAAQSERATGTLTLRDGDAQTATLFFLFGHLFHAVGAEGAGDDAVKGALRWERGEFDFDPKAKLPDDETVRATIGELLEIEGTPAGAEPPAESDAGTEAAADAATMRMEATPLPKQPTAPSYEDETGPALGVKYRPQPKHGREAVPVPAGQVIYDSLKTSFVDFPRLVTTLEREAYTGYVRLLTDSASGLIFFREGTALECVYDAGAESGFELGTPALVDFNDEVTRGRGVLDVVGLSPELVTGLYELTVATPIYSELYASWVDMNSLLRFLEERGLTGSLMVRATKGTGVIILSEGRLSGAYTSDSREIADNAEGVLALCSDPRAVIEVKAAAETAGAVLDVDAVIGSPRSTTVAAPRVAAAPSAAAPTPPPAPAKIEAEPAPIVDEAPAPAVSAEPEHAPAEAPSWPSTSSVSPPPIEQVPTFATAPLTVTPPPLSGGRVDWEAVVGDLQDLTQEALGRHARKVHDVLAAAERSREGIEAAIEQVPGVSILFVDSSRLEVLAKSLRAKLDSVSA